MTTTIHLTRSMQTQVSRIILPAGATGHVIDYQPAINKLTVDFGLGGFVQAIDPRANYFEYTGGRDNEPARAV